MNTCSSLTLILACIIYWQAKEISRAVRDCGPEIDVSMLEHVSPIEWDNVILYGQYVLDRSHIRWPGHRARLKRGYGDRIDVRIAVRLAAHEHVHQGDRMLSGSQGCEQAWSQGHDGAARTGRVDLSSRKHNGDIMFSDLRMT